MLFFSGLDIGVQNNYHLVEMKPLTVKDNISIFENGFPLGFLGGVSRGSVKTEDLFFSEQQEFIEEEDDDEFLQLKKPRGASASSIPNIDPIFGVDLDELTLNKPGFFMMIARFAISIHRKITYFFLTAPMDFMRVVMNLPGNLYFLIRRNY